MPQWEREHKTKEIKLQIGKFGIAKPGNRRVDKKN